MIKTNKKKGFLIIEIITVLSIVIITIIIFGAYLSNSLKTTKYIEDYNEIIEETKDDINTLTKELRKATNDENGAIPFNQTYSNYLSFYNDTDDDGDIERVDYRITGTQLKKSYYEPNFTNNPVTYSYDKEKIITNYARNSTTALFEYYDINNQEIITGSSVDGGPQANPNDIKLIHINLITNKNPNKGPSDYSIKTSVHIRNLKENY